MTVSDEEFMNQKKLPRAEKVMSPCGDKMTNTEIVMKGVGTRQKQRIELVNRYHVATLDYDQEVIFENSRLFIESHS